MPVKRFNDIVTRLLAHGMQQLQRAGGKDIQEFTDVQLRRPCEFARSQMSMNWWNRNYWMNAGAPTRRAARASGFPEARAARRTVVVAMLLFCQRENSLIMAAYGIAVSAFQHQAAVVQLLGQP
jgi:hypothetical protein